VNTVEILSEIVNSPKRCVRLGSFLSKPDDGGDTRVQLNDALLTFFSANSPASCSGAT
jgi:hypothetical protein